ncbi:MAG: hypothetical protein ACR2O3_18320 [Rhizobiaceae bacterium]
MRKCRTQIKIPALVVVLLSMPVDGFAQSSTPVWLDDLQYALVVNHDCEVKEYLSLHEGKLGDRNMYIARAKCVDGRVFDAYKLEPQEEFAIKPCEILSC